MPSLEARLADVEQSVVELDREMLRMRGRAHDLESDRATLRLLTEQVKNLSDRCLELGQNMEAIAKRAAEEAVRQAQNMRDGVGRSRWAVRASWVGMGISAGGFVSAILFHFN